MFIKFKTIFNSIKNLFKTDVDLFLENLKIKTACEEGDIELFNQLYDSKNKLTNKNDLVIAACWKNQNQMYKYLLHEKNFISDEMVQNNLDGNLVAAAARNNLELVTYLLSDNFPIKLNLYYNNEVFKAAVKNKSQDVLSYLLYDKNYKVSDSLINWLNEKENKFAIHMIEKRDLFFKLNQNLITKDKSQKNSKLKI